MFLCLGTISVYQGLGINKKDLRQGHAYYMFPSRSQREHTCSYLWPSNKLGFVLDRPGLFPQDLLFSGSGWRVKRACSSAVPMILNRERTWWFQWEMEGSEAGSPIGCQPSRLGRSIAWRIVCRKVAAWESVPFDIHEVRVNQSEHLWSWLNSRSLASSIVKAVNK